MARRFHLAKRPRGHGLDRYLLDGELIVTAAHHHWARIAVPVMSAFAGLVLVLVLDSFIPASLGPLEDLLWWAWLVVVGWAVWELLKWRHDWFVATDKRLILTYGLITQKVGMMPLAKVTDMSYTRSPMGRLLGYGTFVMESAGLDQALRRVRWVDNPDHTYRAICAEIFGVEDRERVRAGGGDGDEHDHRFEEGPPPHTPGLYVGYVPPQERSGPAESQDDPDDELADESEHDDESAGIRIKYGVSREGDRHGNTDPWRGPDLREPALRDADTGPIPYRRSTTDAGDGWRPTTNEDD